MGLRGVVRATPSAGVAGRSLLACTLVGGEAVVVSQHRLVDLVMVENRVACWESTVSPLASGADSISSAA